jgi:hydrogenase 3 maturation protease
MGVGRGEDDQLGRQLREALGGAAPERVAVLCIGNAGRGDDGYGPAVAAALTGRIHARVFDCGTTPENDLPRAAALEPDAVLFVDAVHLGVEPGSLRILRPGELRSDDLSTHAGSLEHCAEFIERACGARSIVLAAQPESVEQGQALSAAMSAAVARTARVLTALLGPGPQSRSVRRAGT